MKCDDLNGMKLLQDFEITELLKHLNIFRCLHGLAPGYLSDDIRRVADTNCRRLRSSSSDLLTVRPTRLMTMGDRAFSVADSGTLYRMTSPLLPHFLFSEAV